MSYKKIPALAAMVLALTSTGASAAVLTFDFEDGVTGSPYHATPTEGFSGFSDGVIVEDEGGKHLAIGPTDIYHWTDFYIYTQSEFYVGERRFRHELDLVSFDILIPNGGEIRSMGLTIPANTWTTITPNISFWGYLHSWMVGDGVLLDNIQLEEFTASIPEPATWAMLLLGFGLIGMAARHRTNRIAAPVSLAPELNARPGVAPTDARLATLAGNLNTLRRRAVEPPPAGLSE